MKTSMKCLSLIILCLLLLSSCMKDGSGNIKGTVVFKFQKNDVSNLKSTKDDVEPVAAAIIVSVEKQGGGIVFDKEKLELDNLNGVYLSKGLTLPQGNYNLTEFLVTDINNQIIYAAPKNGSLLAQLVSNPLPLSFTVNSNFESILDPEVIKTDSISLGNLGYEGFSFNYIKSIKFFISVFTKSTSTDWQHIDSSYLLIHSPVGKTYDFVLGNAVNSVYLNGDSGKYILTIMKKGYKSWIDTLSLNQLEKFVTSPLQVVLTSINDLNVWVLYNNDNDYHFWSGPIITTNTPSNFNVDWGNGFSEMVTTQNNSFDFSGQGDHIGDRLLQIWGPLDQIKTVTLLNNVGSETLTNYKSLDFSNATALESFYLFNLPPIDLNLGNMVSLKNVVVISSQVKSINLTNCINLTSINFNGNDPDILDIRTNKNLIFLSFGGATTVMFGENPNLKQIRLDNKNGVLLDETKINALLTGLLASIVKSPREGTFSVNQQDVYNFNPTNEGLLAVRTLKSTYNWKFFPDIE